MGIAVPGASTDRRGPRINARELVMITVEGQVADPLSGKVPYRIGQDGASRILPGSGGIVLSHRVGDPCIGLAADHVEPGVSIRNERRAASGDRDGANLALNTYACIGNLGVVVNGPALGARGTVTGKHGGVNNVLMDFPLAIMKKLRLRDRIQVFAYGVGLKLLDHPDIAAFNCAPRLLARWGLKTRGRKLVVPVTHMVPAAIMGSGLGRSSTARGDHDIQLFDQGVARRFHLNSLRFGDLVAILDADNRFGRSFKQGCVSLGVVVHSESTVAGHGPGVVTLMTGPESAFALDRDPTANLAGILSIRAAVPPRARLPLIARERSMRLPPPREALRLHA